MTETPLLAPFTPPAALRDPDDAAPPALAAAHTHGDAAAREGPALSFTDAITYALEEPTRAPRCTTPPRDASAAHAQRPRAHDVAARVKGRRTLRQYRAPNHRPPRGAVRQRR
jgi:hypothetical protein